MDIYTPIEEAGRLIQQRWNDISLRKIVEDRFNGDIPDIVKESPSGIIFRQIATPDGEFKRFLNLTSISGVKPLAFEYTEDIFHSGNFTKIGLGKLVFSDGINKHGKHIVTKKTILDFNNSQSKKMSELKTFWDESFVDFHHFIMVEKFPIMKHSMVDMTQWFKRQGGSPEKYYPSLFMLALSHFIFFDDYDLLESEDDFVDEVVLPAFNKIKEEFNIKPVVVKISNPGEHNFDPYWWCYDKDVKTMVDNHIKNIQ